MIKEYNEIIQIFLINEKSLFPYKYSAHKEIIYGGSDINETHNTEIADIYAELKINPNQNKKQVNLDDFNNLISNLIDTHSKLDDILDDFIEKLELQISLAIK